MSTYRFGPFLLDAPRLLLSAGGEPLALGPKVVETLLALVERPGAVLSKSELLDRIWPEGFVEEANLAQNVYVLRKTLRAYWDVETIVTVPRRGYRFVAAVSAGDIPPSRVLTPTRNNRFFPGAVVAAIAATLLLAVSFAAISRQHVAARTTAPALSQQGARYYAIGHFYWNQRTQSGVEKSLRYFARVVATDPRDPRGYAALATADALMGDYHYGRLPHKVYFARARAYAERALALDAASAEAHAALGIAEDQQGGRASALAEYQRALALNPGYAPARQWYGIALLMQGKTEKAYRELERAAQLDPFSVATAAWLSDAAYLTRRYQTAVAYAQQTLDLSPQRSDAYWSMGLAYEAMGDYQNADKSYQHFARTCACRTEVAALLAHVYAKMHRFEAAREQLLIAQSGMANKRVDLQDVVVAFIAMGQRDEALRLLRSGHR
ncbi:MAG: winged helix-turn-helix domain-containing protein, partial [Candidatus Eremiobacteraeota bacterium]|nr:winged helix-turn-helix domain-containing protein [Candidatus Eremiobacteraeota bacterium]